MAQKYTPRAQVTLNVPLHPQACKLLFFNREAVEPERLDELETVDADAYRHNVKWYVALRASRVCVRATALVETINAGAEQGYGQELPARVLQRTTKVPISLVSPPSLPPSPEGRGRRAHGNLTVREVGP